jgi:flavin-binding protein dodecin
MTPGEVAEIRATSDTSIEDAIRRGIAALHKTIRDVRCLWMRGRSETTAAGAPRAYQVDMVITFIGEDWRSTTAWPVP